MNIFIISDSVRATVLFGCGMAGARVIVYAVKPLELP